MAVRSVSSALGRVLAAIAFSTAAYGCAEGIEDPPIAAVEGEASTYVPLPSGGGSGAANAAEGGKEDGGVISAGPDAGSNGGPAGGAGSSCVAATAQTAIPAPATKTCRTVALSTARLLDGRLSDEEFYCPAEGLVPGQYPYATMVIHNPHAVPVQIQVQTSSASYQELLTWFYPQATLPTSPAERLACADVIGYIDDFEIPAGDTYLLVIASYEAVGSPYVATGTVEVYVENLSVP
jgi:hypothetical protein